MIFVKFEKCRRITFFIFLMAELTTACMMGKKNFVIADCSQRHLNDVPSNLPSQIEVLNLSDNRIRELHDNSFTSYTKTKILSLRQNTIYYIEKHTFVPLTKLTHLDLSVNALFEFPPNLPSSLLQLSLDENPKIDIFENAFDNVISLTDVPYLQVLSIRSNRLKSFPKFGTYEPNLIELDVSGNNFSQITSTNISPLCGLKRLKISPQKYYDSTKASCDCVKFEKWAKSRGIEMPDDVCQIKESTDCNTDSDSTAVAMYEECLNEAKARQFPGKIMLYVGTIFGLIIIVSVTFGVYYWKKRKIRKLPIESTNTSNSVVDVEINSTVYDNHCVSD